MIQSGSIQDLGCQWHESLVHDQEKTNYYFSFLKIFYSYFKPFSIFDLIKVTISYEFLKMDGKNMVSL